MTRFRDLQSRFSPDFTSTQQTLPLTTVTKSTSARGLSLLKYMSSRPWAENACATAFSAMAPRLASVFPPNTSWNTDLS